MSKLIEIEGIGPAIAKIFETHALKTVDQLLERGKDRDGRVQLAEETGLPYKMILRWTNMADLFRIKGVAEEYSDLLEASGVDTVVELARRNAGNLHRTMTEINEQRKLVRAMPSEKQVTDWVAQAKELPRVMTY
ncbi:MAG: DUF4332 domain-containing protein [Acidobacteriota bacterium]|nr:DUF4332 domain-containing protein [Acidobacteriota bacterium]